jgi:hypothetical protein
MRWLNARLPVPSQFVLPKRHGRYGVCWLKDDASEHIRRLRDLATILEHNGS